MTRRVFQEQLRKKQTQLFNTNVVIFVNKSFRTQHVLRFNLDFFPDDFFVNQRLKDYETRIENAQKPAFRMTGGLHYCPISDSENFSFGAQERLTTYLKNLMKQVMIRYGHAKSTHDFGWQLGFLWTAEGANEQDRHVDYEHGAMRKFLKRGDNPCLPYSMDMPLTEGGMKLNYYGPQEQLYAVPLVIKCPFKQCVVWRGNAVHCGAHRDLNGGGGFRVHGYLHMNPGGRAAMSNTVLAKIEWSDSKAERYTHFLKNSTCEPFLRGNDR